MNTSANSQRLQALATSTRRRRTAGSILVNVAIAMSLIVITLIGTELGYLFYVKRELQKTADLAALAGAQGLGVNNCATATSAAITNAAQNMPAGIAPLAANNIVCGRWDPAAWPTAPHFGAPGAGQKFNAVRVTISRTPAVLMPGIFGNQPRTITVGALAAQQYPRANLTIRSTLVTIDSTQSPLLNAVFGGLLGGSLNVSLAGWNGLLNTKLQLLTYIDQLGINLGIGVGKYDQVLSTSVSVGTLIQAMIDALQQSGNTAQIVLDALNLIKLTANAAAAQPLLKLGDLLGIQTGTDAAGLQTDVQLLQLLQGLVQAANGKSGVVATVALPLPGLATVTTNVKVIEPPQVSATGNPILAKLNPTGPDQIYVRTAQVRALISIDLPALNGITDLLNALTTALSPVTDLLNNLLSLNLAASVKNLLDCLFACTRNVTDIRILPAPVRLDISLDAGGGASRVTDYSCAANATSLTAQTTTSAATLRIGSLGATAAIAKANAFSSSAPPTVSPVPIIDIGSQTCHVVLLGISTSCDPSTRQAYYGGGLGLQADVPVGATTQSQFFANPPTLDQQPAYLAIATQNIVNSLTNTLNALNLLIAIPPTAPGGGLSNVLTGLTNTLSAVINLLIGIIKGVLSPLIDPLLNTLLSNVLGANVAQTEVGGRLTCASGAVLVY
ncbi:TadG family pilus assembly protein [Variovorax sp. EL159]|uniref:TadG family pilus assembly protein n=1 Tax=Variovorax sp. EL159 TaxID=1566270 RepID=UPI00087E6D09|nr:TadG family pilus assembly protein [Variovorax sp. EL159]SCX74045.1 Putative Tad-like Flp pilus-assembly [Variovorax sp. EL159]